MLILFFPLAFSSLEVSCEITTSSFKEGKENIQQTITIDSSINNFTEISSWDINYGAARHITIEGDLAFVSTAESLIILKFSNPANIEIIYTFNFDTNYGAEKAVVNDDYVFFPVFDLGVFIFDIKNTSAIYMVHHIYDSTYYKSVDVQGNFLFINNPTIIKIYNIAVITNPIYIGYYAGEDLQSFDVEGDYLFEITNTKLIVVDVSNPSVPIQVGSYTRGDRDFNDLVVFGDYCYIASGSHGVHIINVNSKSSPSFSGECYDSDGGYAYTLCYENDFVYLADGFNCLEIINVSNRVSPFEAGDYDETGDWIAVDVSGNAVLLSGVFFTNKITMVDVFAKDSPNKVGEFSMGGYATGVWAEGNHVFLCNLLEGLNILDISDINNPTLISNYNDGFGAHEVYVRDDIIYLAAYFDGFRIINWSTPSNLQEIYEDSTSLDDARGVAVDGDIAYVVDHPDGIYIFNVSNPQAITFIDHFFEDYAACNLAIVGKFLYLANGMNGLNIINITDPSNLVKVSEFTYTNCYSMDVCVKDDVAYIADMDNGLVIVDVAVKDAPVKITEITSIYCLGVFIEDNHLFVAAGKAGVLIYDVTDPTNPTLIDQIVDGGRAEDVFVSGDYVFVADGIDGFEILGADPLDPDNFPTTSKKFSLMGSFISLLLITTSSLAIIPIIKRKKKL